MGSSRLDHITERGLGTLLLRAFLGVTFVVAGVQKLANPGFLQSATPGSFEEQLRGAVVTSPLHHLLDPALHAPVAVALLIACGELAVGMGTLFGLFGRVAAIGGLLLSLTFFLTISFNDSPYYYGADIVFAFAWTPFVIGGSGPWSLDAVLARRAARCAELGEPGTTLPVAAGASPGVGRRVALQRLFAAGTVASAAALAGGLGAAIGRLVTPTASGNGQGGSTTGGPTTGSGAPSGTGTGGTATTGAGGNSTSGSSTSGSSTSGSSTNGGVAVLDASEVPVGGAAPFTDPGEELPAYAVQPKAGSYRAFSAVCTHAGCTVLFDQNAETFNCPCHGSVFDAATGAVVQGPAPRPLPAIPIRLGPGGRLFAEG